MTVTIFEGADGAGKTTLIDGLGPLHATAVENFGPYQGETQIAHYYLAALKLAYDGHLFMDRSWLAEPIYGRAFRNGEDRVGVARRRMLDRIALALRGVVVRCAPRFEACQAAFARRRAVGKEYLDTDAQLREVYTDYLRALQTALPVVDFDWQREDMADLWARVEAKRPAANDGPGIGRWAPDEVTLLVGDRMNAPPADGVDLPFVSFNSSGCSVWLADELERAGVSEASLYWINAFNADGGATDAAFVAQLRPRKIVALGVHATAWCEAAKFAHVTVAHPQYHKRFKAHEPYPLCALLQEVL